MLDKTFRPRDIEDRWYRRWEEDGIFACGTRPEAAPFAIVIPPPNVTGSLHMGHALNNTLQDILARQARMVGKDVLWQPGTDHAGIATQMVVERQLATEGLTRHDLGRADFIERVWTWKGQSGGTIIGQLRRLGASCDWSRERFTMDQGLSAAVLKVFVDLHRRGLIYRDKRLVNWDPQLHTAISDLEVESREERGKMWTIRYPIEGEAERFIAVATTRPETMLGDTAVAVHPDDPRYADLIGRNVILPIGERPIPIVADEHADPSKGTGAVKITPAHDFNDFEVGKRHNLPMINVLDSKARLKSSEFDDFSFGHRAPRAGRSAVFADEEQAGPPTIDYIPERFRGLDRYVARERIVEELTTLGLLDKVDDHVLMLPYGDRSGVVVEPWLMDQWFVDAKTLAGPAIAAVEEGRVRFVPEQWTKTYYEWMRNIQPWCISRQIWWGHQIPAWYDADGNVFVEESEELALAAAERRHGRSVSLTRDPDVLDTWFSSALWPFSTLGWPEHTPELARYYPTDVLVTGFDIIFFWVARMMMMGIDCMGDVPFRTVYVHALVRDESGQKMSKSKGNVIDPLALIDRFGADALRFTLTALAVQGRDVKLSESRVEGYRNFCTKLWNAARFCQMNGAVITDGFDPESCRAPVNVWIVAKLAAAAERATAALAEYRFNDYAESLYHFVWGTFCDWYLELIKPVLSSGDDSVQAETRQCTAWVLDCVLRLLHPVMPFLTEELHHALSEGRVGLLTLKAWPQPTAPADGTVVDEIDWLVRLITQVRIVRSELNVPPSARVPLHVVADDAVAARLERNDVLIRNLARTVALARSDASTAAPEDVLRTSVQFVQDQATVFVGVAGVIDVESERRRLAREIDKLEGDILRSEKKLANDGFIARAPAEVVETERERRDEAMSARTRLRSALERLATL